MRTWDKDPQAVLPWEFDWSDWLEVGETISSATVTVATGLTLQSQSNTSTVVTVWLSGGTLGATYTVACRVTTSLAKVDERTLAVRITDR